MVRKVFTALLIFLTCCWSTVSLAQPSTLQTSNSHEPYHPPAEDKIEWQRLLLLLSSTYFHVVKEAQVNLDSSLLYTSASLGLSRFPVIAEGIEDPALAIHSGWIDRRNPAEGINHLSKATGKKRLDLLVLLGSYYAFQPDSYERYRDSVQFFLTKVINESKNTNEERLRRQALCILGKMFAQANDLVRSDSVFDWAIRESRLVGDRLTEARALAYRGLYTAFSPATTETRISDLLKAAELFRGLNNVEGEINALTNSGYLYVVSFQLDKAVVVFLRALQLEELIGFPYTHYNADAVAMATGHQGKFGEPLRYTLQAIKSAEVNRDSIGWAYFYSRLGSLYISEGGREAEAEKWQTRAFNRFVVTGDPALYIALNNMLASRRDDDEQILALILNTAKKVPPENLRDRFCYDLALATSYLRLEQYELAEKHALLADGLQKQLEPFIGPFRRAMIAYVFGNIYYRKGEYAKSKIFYKKFLSDPSRGAQTFSSGLGVYRNLIHIDSIFHDYASGLLHYKQYTKALDSVFAISKIRQAEELQVIYQTEEKENQITLLNQQARLEQATTKQAMLLKNVTIGGIVGVLIIAGLLYRQTRLKQKNNNVITRKNELLQHFLTEKEWLLKEIHHRVKNNLQIVMSLLNSQSAYIENDAALTAIHDSQHRVHAMSLIHQKLYNSENVSSIDMASYIPELVSYLRDSFNVGQRIRFEMNIEALDLDVGKAIPVGLILNEAITNAIKYAFPDEGRGIITISLSSTSSDHFLLCIADNGIGMPPHLNKNRPGSLGMSLMSGLSEDLEGVFSVENNSGTAIKISFIHDPGLKLPETLASTFVASH